MEMIGGQAVIEGVMIKNKNRIATAVRTRDGILVKTQNFKSVTEKHKLLKLPIIRGTIILIETVVIGTKILSWSADIAMKGTDKKNKNNSTSLIIPTLLAIIIAVGIFMFLPLWATTNFFNLEKNAGSFNLLAGAIRIGLFILYIYAISYWKDVKILFRYHGAEHKIVNCYENELSPCVDSAKKYSRIHNRCGTSFLLVALIIAIIGFAIIDTSVGLLLGYTNLLIRLATHLLFLPLILGVSYEVIRKAQNPNWFIKILITPGLLLQKITTGEPDDKQLEVALYALKNVTT
ncbi:MAG: DUF1385 domain-containing protein [Nanoarchaeota archaeon]